MADRQCTNFLLLDGAMKPSTIERFEKHYIPEPMSGCWLWTAATDCRGMGYGFFHMGNGHHSIKAHVAAYRLLKGPTNGLFVLHTCDVPICVNPDHLFLGTHQDNVDDRERKGRGGCAYGEAHGLSTLTTEKVLAIRADPRATRFIVKDYGIHSTTVRKIKRRALWAHLP